MLGTNTRAVMYFRILLGVMSVTHFIGRQIYLHKSLFREIELEEDYILISKKRFMAPVACFIRRPPSPIAPKTYIIFL